MNELLLINAQFNRIVNKFNVVRKKRIQYDRGHALYPAEMQVLVVVSAKPGITVSVLGEELYITKSAVSQIVRKLSNKKYLTKKRLPDNERIVELYLTEDGKKAVQAFMEFEVGIAEDLFKHMKDISQKDKAVVKNLFNSLEKMMDEKLKMHG